MKSSNSMLQPSKYFCHLLVHMWSTNWNNKWLSENCLLGCEPEKELQYLKFAFKVLKLQLSSRKSFNMNGSAWKTTWQCWLLDVILKTYLLRMCSYCFKRMYILISHIPPWGIPWCFCILVIKVWVNQKHERKVGK